MLEATDHIGAVVNAEPPTAGDLEKSGPGDRSYHAEEAVVESPLPVILPDESVPSSGPDPTSDPLAGPARSEFLNEIIEQVIDRMRGREEPPAYVG